MAPDLSRVFILGGPCSGKSTVATRLGEITGHPVTHLDDLFWGPGWREPDRDEFRRTVQKIADRETWVIDGSYSVVRQMLFGRATLAIYLDVALPVMLWRIVARTISRNTPLKIVHHPPPLPRQVAESGGGENVFAAIYDLSTYALRFRGKRRDARITEARRATGDGRLVVLSSPRKVREFLRNANERKPT